MNNGWATQRATYASGIIKATEAIDLLLERIRLLNVLSERHGKDVYRVRIRNANKALKDAKEERERLQKLITEGDAVARANEVVADGKRELDLCRRISEEKKITVAPGPLSEFNASELMTLAAALTTFMKDIEVLNHDDSRDMYNAHRRNIEALINKFEDYANSRGL